MIGSLCGLHVITLKCEEERGEWRRRGERTERRERRGRKGRKGRCIVIPDLVVE